MIARMKTRLFALLLVAALVAALSPASAFAAGPVHSKGIILMLDGIKGEAADVAYKDGIDILSTSFGIESPVAVNGGSGSGAGKPSYSALSLTKFVDSASLAIIRSMAQGTAIKSGSLYFFNGASSKPYLTIDMKNILVTSEQMSADGEDRITESVSLNFKQVIFTYLIIGPDGRETKQILDIDITKNIVR